METDATETPKPYRGVRKPRRSQEGREFCLRVRWLIDTYDEGNVASAARRLGVSQRGLQKVYAGETTSPKLVFIQRVIRRYRAVDANWIMTGKRSDSEDMLASAAQAHALAIVGSMLATIDGNR